MRPPLRSSNWSNSDRIKFVVAYDGSEFRGWAPQRGQRTVHGTLTEAVRQISGDDCEIYGASRTDSGAHALGQVCHFDCKVAVPIERWTKAINHILPPDVTVLKAVKVDPEFNSRFWADRRWYRYRIQTGWRDPHRTRYAHHYSAQTLDVDAMINVAEEFVGVKDFLAFSQLVEEGKNTVRELFEVKVRKVKDEIWIDIVGTAFVRGMMRRISGALWEVGRGARTRQEISELFLKKNKNEIEWPTVLPACGLTLMKVTYGRRPYDRRQDRRTTTEGDDG